MNRNETIDIARGIAIILMCIGHAYCPDMLCKFIYMFHMAFFFITSGYFFNKEKSISSPWEFIVKRIKGLWIPFVKWGIIFTFLHNVFLDLKLLTPGNHYYGIKETFWKAFTTNTRFIPTEEMMGPYWFFSCLFYVSIFSLLIFYITNKFTNKRWIESSVFSFFYLLGFYIIFTTGGGILDNLTRTFVVSFLFYIGYLWAMYNDRIKYDWLGLILSISVLLIGAFSKYGEIAIPEQKFQGPILFLVYSISGTYMLLCMSKYIEKYSNGVKKFLSYAGSKTLIILLSNMLCIRIFHVIRSSIQGYEGYPTTITQNESDWYWWILYTVFMVVVPLGVDWTINYIKLRTKVLFKK